MVPIPEKLLLLRRRFSRRGIAGMPADVRWSVTESQAPIALRWEGLGPANQTVRGVLRLGWLPDGHGPRTGQMAMPVKPNGLFGAAYLAAIRPLRYLIVYPLMLPLIAREWQAVLRGRPDEAGAG